VLREALTLTPYLRGKHDPLLDHEAPGQEGLQSREELLLGQGGEEAEPAQIDAQDRHAQVSHEAGHGQERAVSAHYEEEIELAGQVGLARGGRLRVRTEP